MSRFGIQNKTIYLCLKASTRKQHFWDWSSLGEKEVPPIQLSFSQQEWVNMAMNFFI